MFTGIIENTGTIVHIEKEGSNIHFTLEAPFAQELKVDQSLAHDGVCLTVVKVLDNTYTVTAVEETLLRTNLRQWKTGGSVNLERCMKIGDRLDGHIVQGHVDTTAICELKEDHNGSWLFRFTHAVQPEYMTVSKGSITVNGVSLTVVDSSPGYFSVAIIPYTHTHTNFQFLQPGENVNLEFDIIGKYISRYMSARS